MSAPPSIRLATVLDAAALAEFGARCFRESFAAQNDLTDIELHVSRTFAPALQTRELEDPANSYLLAAAGSAIAGYSLLRRDAPHPDVPGPRPWEVRRFYVDHAWHGRGVAAALMRATQALARDGGAGTLWLSAWEHNPRALGFYAKLGFRDVGAGTFMLGTSAQTDRLLAMTP